MTGLGVCGSCGGELGEGSLRLALEAGPGPRGLVRTSVTGTRLDRFDVCQNCLAGESAAGTVLTKMLDDGFTRALAPVSRRCVVTCVQPRRRSKVFVSRKRAHEFESAYCPVCFGKADVAAAEGARPVRISLLDRLRDRLPVREPWDVEGGGEE